MSRIPLTNGFTMMSEGIHVLKIVKAEYNEDFGKITITLENQKGQKHFERFSLLAADGSTNDAAYGAFSGLAKAALDDSSAQDVDVDELVGLYVKGQISIREYEGRDGSTRKTTQKEPGTYWEAATPDEMSEFEGQTATKPAKKSGSVDLGSLLGR